MHARSHRTPLRCLTAPLGPHHPFRADWRLAVADSVWISRSPHYVRHSVVMDSSESPS